MSRWVTGYGALLPGSRQAVTTLNYAVPNQTNPSR